MDKKKKKQYEKPECKKFFREPELKRKGQLNKVIGGSCNSCGSCVSCA